MLTFDEISFVINVIPQGYQKTWGFSKYYFYDDKH